MSNLKMRIHSEANTLRMTIAWADEEEYQLGKEFLTEIGARCRQSGDVTGDEPAYYYLETKQQYDALLNFRQSLREKRKT